MSVDSIARPIALFGGTFDPVHLGHLRVAWEAAEALDADVRIIPVRVPPHRPAPIASVEQRVAILKLALAGQKRLMLDERELKRPGTSYTFDTLQELRTEVGRTQPLILLLGADAFAGLPGWHRWRELFVHAHIVALTRPGHGMTLPSELAAEITARRTDSADLLRTTPAGRVLSLPVTPLEISASAIRDLIATGREPRYLLPETLLRSPELLAVYRT